MKMDKYTKIYLDGQLHAYFELLEKGIRDVCTINHGVFKKREYDFVVKRVRKRGFRTLLITDNQIDNKGNKFER